MMGGLELERNGVRGAGAPIFHGYFLGGKLESGRMVTARGGGLALRARSCADCESARTAPANQMASVSHPGIGSRRAIRREGSDTNICIVNRLFCRNVPYDLEDRVPISRNLPGNRRNARSPTGNPSMHLVANTTSLNRVERTSPMTFFGPPKSPIHTCTHHSTT